MLRCFAIATNASLLFIVILLAPAHSDVEGGRFYLLSGQTETGNWTINDASNDEQTRMTSAAVLVLTAGQRQESGVVWLRSTTSRAPWITRTLAEHFFDSSAVSDLEAATVRWSSTPAYLLEIRDSFETIEALLLAKRTGLSPSSRVALEGLLVFQQSDGSFTDGPEADEITTAQAVIALSLLSSTLR